MDLKDKVEALLDEAHKKFLKVGVFERDTYIYHEIQDFDILEAQTQKKYHFPGTKIGLKIKEERGNIQIDWQESPGHMIVLDKTYKHPAVYSSNKDKYPLLALHPLFQTPLIVKNKEQFMQVCIHTFENGIDSLKSGSGYSGLKTAHFYFPLNNFEEFEVKD